MLISALLLCVSMFFPIGEKDLLEPETRWPNRIQYDNDTLREVFLRNTGYQDSLGRVDDRIKVWLLAECEGDTAYSLFLVNGLEGDRDDAVWLVLRSGNTILARSMIAALQTSCESTFLMASSITESNLVTMHRLNHVFDCEADKYLRTDTLSPVRIHVYDDHTEHIND